MMLVRAKISAKPKHADSREYAHADCFPNFTVLNFSGLPAGHGRTTPLTMAWHDLVGLDSNVHRHI